MFLNRKRFDIIHAIFFIILFIGLQPSKTRGFYCGGSIGISQLQQNSIFHLTATIINTVTIKEKNKSSSRAFEYSAFLGQELFRWDHVTGGFEFGYLKDHNKNKSKKKNRSQFILGDDDITSVTLSRQDSFLAGLKFTYFKENFGIYVKPQVIYSSFSLNANIENHANSKKFNRTGISLTLGFESKFKDNLFGFFEYSEQFYPKINKEMKLMAIDKTYITSTPRFTSFRIGIRYEI